MMTILFFGTSAGKPTKTRNLPAAGLFFEQRSSWWLFDCGEGTQHQIQRAGLSLKAIERLFITHLHGDHCFGLFGLLGTRSLQNVSAPLVVYGPKGIKRLLETVISLSQMRLCFNLSVIEVEAGDKMEFGHARVEVFGLSHRIETVGFLIREADKIGAFDAARAKAYNIPPGPLYGRLKRGEKITLPDGRIVNGVDFLGPTVPGRTLFIAGDNDNPYLLLAQIGSVDCLVHEATYTQSVYEKISCSTSHSTARAVAEAAQKAQVKNLILTHFSARFNNTQDGLMVLYSEARSFYSGSLYLANDLQRFILTSQGNILASSF